MQQVGAEGAKLLKSIRGLIAPILSGSQGKGLPVVVLLGGLLLSSYAFAGSASISTPSVDRDGSYTVSWSWTHPWSNPPVLKENGVAIGSGGSGSISRTRGTGEYNYTLHGCVRVQGAYPGTYYDSCWSADATTIVAKTPGNPNVTASPASCSSNTISWSPGSGNPSGASVRYELTYSGGITPLASGTGTSFSHTGLNEKQSYTYSVRSYYVYHGYSSNWSSYKTVAATTLYCQPGTPDAPVLSQPDVNDHDNVLVSWNTPDGAALNFRLQSRNATTASSWADIYTGPDTSYTDSRAKTADHSYEYRVQAYNSDQSGNWSLTATRRIPYARPGIPSQISASDIDPEAKSFTVNWSAASGVVERYRLQESIDGALQWGTIYYDDGLSHGVTGKINDNSYNYRVQACNVDGCSDYVDSQFIRMPFTTPGQTGALSISNINSPAGSLTVDWTAAAGTVEQYTVEQSLDGGASWSTVQSTLATSYRADNLNKGDSYTYRVRACNVDACGPNTANKTVYLPYVIPGTPGGISGSDIDPVNQSFTLNWDAASGDAHRYELQESLDSGGTWSAPIVVTTNSYAAQNKTSGTDYSYRARACNNDDACSAYSAAALIRLPYAAPGVPSLDVNNINASNGSYNTSWNASTGTVHNYRLEESIDSGANWIQVYSGTGLSFPVSGKTNGETYSYRVRACNTDSCSGYSSPADAYVPFLPPSDPDAIQASNIDAATRSYTLDWPVATGTISNYELQESEDGGVSWIALASVTTNSHSVSNKVNGATYTYRVRACNVDSCGAYSVTTDVRLPHAAPGIPGAGTVSDIDAATRSHNISWGGATGTVTRYELERTEGYNSNDWITIQADNTTNHSASGLTNGSTYHYRVRACNEDACGEYNSSSSIRMPYSAPGVAGDIVANEINPANGSYRLNWTAATGTVERYELDQSSDAAPASWATIFSGPTVSALVNNLSENTVSHYRVRACNQDACGTYTTVYTMRLPYAIPAVPGAITSSNIDVDTRSLTLNWGITAGTVANYELQYSTDGLAWFIPVTISQNTYQATGLTHGQTYLYRVRACNQDGCSAYTGNHIARLPYAAPATPASITINNVNHANQSYTVNWGFVADDVTYYHLQENDTEGEDWLTVFNTVGQEYQATDHKEGRRYQYRVRACNDDGCSNYSSVATVYLPLATPGLPGEITANDYEIPAGTPPLGAYQLVWGAASGTVTSYELQALNTQGQWVTIYGEAGLSHPVSDVQPGTSAVYRVRACNRDGCGSYTEPKTINMLPPVAAVPASISVSGYSICESSTAAIEWNASTDGNRYQLEQKTADDDWQTIAMNVSGTSHSAALYKGVSYQFRVRARIYINGQYGEWSGWRTSSPATVSYCSSTFVPKFSPSGMYSVSYSTQTQYPNQTTNLMEKTPTSGWYKIADYSKTFDSANRKSTGVYEYYGSYCFYYGSTGSMFTCYDTQINGITVIREPGTPSIPGFASNMGSANPGAFTGKTFTIDWSAISAPGGASIIYELDSQVEFQSRYEGDDHPDWINIYRGGSINQNITIDTMGLKYHYRVRACATLNGYENCSGYSPTFTVNTQLPPPKVSYPEGLAVYSTHVPLQWQPPAGYENAVHHYEIMLEGELVGSTTDLSIMLEIPTAGYKVFEIRACGSGDTRSCGEAAQVGIAVLLVPEPPEKPGDIYGEHHPDVAGSQFNGIVSGELSVDPSGAATYSVPIVVPPGTGNAVPQLALSYNSNGGNGIAGWGWNVGGASSVIHRCNKTKAQDGVISGVTYTDNDALCLDGRRLYSVALAANAPAGAVAQYRPELNDFSRIYKMPSGGSCPAWFEMHTQDGEILRYGYSDDACVEVTRGVAMWALERATDRNGNYIQYQYLEDNAAANDNVIDNFRIERIGYSGHSSNLDPYTWIDFVYSARPDSNSGFQAGVQTKQSLRLRQVKSDAGTYTLNYLEAGSHGDRVSKLASIGFCATDPQTLNQQCLDPLSFEWSDLRAGWVKVDSQYVAPQPIIEVIPEGSSRPAFGKDLGARFVDVDGDGLMDVLYALQGASFSAWRNTGNGFVSWPNFVPPVPFVNFRTTNEDDDMRRNVDLGVRLVDLNGDARPELITAEADGNGGYKVYKNDSINGWIYWPQWNVPVSGFDGHTDTGGDHGVRYVDLNSDGLTDILWGYNTASFGAWRNTGNGWQAWPEYTVPVSFTYRPYRRTLNDWQTLPRDVQLVDLNGDGLVDIFGGNYYPVCTEWKTMSDGSEECVAKIGNSKVFIPGMQTVAGNQVYLNTGSGWALSAEFMIDVAVTQLEDEGVRMADINGDRLPDILIGKDGNRHAYFNTGNGWQHDDTGSYAQFDFVINGDDSTPLRMMDLNVDGLTDVYNGGTLINTGSGWFEDSVYAPPYVAKDGNYVDLGVQSIDLNGDGRVDFMSAFISGSGATTKYSWLNGSQLRRLEIIRDGLGNTNRIRYKTLTDDSPDGRTLPLYTPVSYELDEPEELEYRMPMQVVDRIELDNGIGGIATTEYAYQGLVIRPSDRGSQGFEKTTTLLPDGTRKINTYAQSYPYTGMPLTTETYINSEPVAYTVNRYCYLPATAMQSIDIETGETCPVYDDATMNGPLFVYTYETQTTQYLLDNNTQSTGDTLQTTIRNKYDRYANATWGETKTSGDGHVYRETAVNQFSGDDYWKWRKRTLEATVSRSRDGSAQVNGQHAVAFEYKSGHAGLVRVEKVNPGANAPEELHTAFDYDAFGNVITTTVCATDFASCNAGATTAATPQFRTSTASFDSADHPASPGYANGRFPVRVTNAEGLTEYHRFDHPLGLATELIGPNGITTQWQHDAFGRKLKEIAYVGSAAEYSTAWNYRRTAGDYTPWATHTVEVSTEAAAPVRSYYDALGHELRTLTQNLHGEFIASDTEYDTLGRIRRRSEPYFVHSSSPTDRYWTVTHYDPLGRPERVDAPAGDRDGDFVDEPLLTVTTHYNGYANVIIDPKGRQKRVVKNALDQTVSMQSDYQGSLETRVDYDYDGGGNLVSTIVNGNAATEIRLGYDLRGHKEWMEDPDMGRWDYQYNGYGELIWQRDAKQQVTEIQYDKLGRMTQRTDLAGTPNAYLSTWRYHDNTAPAGSRGKLFHESGGSQGSSKEYVYDSLGRLTDTIYNVGMSGDMATFTTSQAYDTYSRVKSVIYPEVGGKRFQVDYVYSRFGPLWYVVDPGGNLNDDSDDSLYWLADVVNERGQIVQERMRNRNIITRQFNTATGWLLQIQSWDRNVDTLGSGAPIDPMIQQTRYEYDAAGNMESRERFKPYIITENNELIFQEELGGGFDQVTESFTYDSLDRIKTAAIVRDGAPTSIKEYGYDSLGNMAYKDSSSNVYSYNSCNAGIHAVCSANGNSYQYDANGNMTGGGGRTIQYNAFNKPENLSGSDYQGGHHTVNFYYGPDRSRMFKLAMPNQNGNREHTYYVGLGATGGTLYQQKVQRDGMGNIIDREHIHYIYAGDYHGGQAFAMQVIEEDVQGNIFYDSTEYIHRDHLGSVIAITDDLGTIRDVLGNVRAHLKSYDAWGKERDPTTWEDYAPAQPREKSVRGHLTYTGHEAIPELDLIHMNGRVYDPDLARFLSADPHIQDPQSSESYNRYSYVWNNPLRYTDPSGYFVQVIIGIALAIAEVKVTTAMAVMFLYTLSDTGSVQAAFFAAVSVGIAHGIGTEFLDATGGRLFAKHVIHGISQGTITSLSGGKFRDGFAGGFVGSVAGNYVPDGVILGTMTSYLAGGLAAEAAGGDFHEGGKSAAMVHLFNHLEHEEDNNTGNNNAPKTYPGECEANMSCIGGDQGETRVDYSTWNVNISIKNFFSISLEVNKDYYGETYFGLGLSWGPSALPVTISYTEARLAFWDVAPSREILEGHLTGWEMQALVGAGRAKGYSVPLSGGNSLAPDHLIWESGYSMPQIGVGGNYSWNVSDWIK